MTPADIRLSKMVQKALISAAPSLATIAKRAGLQPGAVYRYKKGSRTPDTQTLRAPAKVLREQAGDLMAHAAQLDAESNR